jgi:hypothetical protein
MDYLTRQLLLELIKLREAYQKQNSAVDFIQKRTREQQQIGSKRSEEFLAAYQKFEGDKSESDKRSHGVQSSIRYATWLAALSTTFAFGAAAYYAWITNNMWKAMKCANALVEMNYVNDQRAWIGFLLQSSYQIRADAITKKPVDIVVPIGVANTGKTPAFKVTGHMVVTVISKGEKLPLGEYGPGHFSYRVDGGVIFPNGQMGLAQPARRHTPTRAEIIVPTPDLLHKMDKEDAFIVVYGRIEYFDYRQRPHWLTFCRYVSTPGLVDADCLHYNETDNESTHPKSCPVTESRFESPETRVNDLLASDS